MALRAISANQLQSAASVLRPVVAAPRRAITANQLQRAAAALRPMAAEAPQMEAAIPAGDEEPLPCITLTFMDGTEMELELNFGDRVHDLRSQVAWKLGLTDARVKLMFGARLLQMNESLSAVGIGGGAVVNVVIVPPLYQGSQAYNALADAYASAIDDDGRRRRGDEVEEDVHTALQDMMAKKMHLNDAFAKLRLRK
uniref:Ubiquitin-like domain-containing protein n=1 Tax=Alexandrium catenella TaxID=2925 RepID=A0A7S1W640_ALECA